MTDILSSTELTEMICTRLSHDLIGNIGAVANAVELLEDDPDCVPEIKPILETSAQTLTARLKFFRLAFGLDNACPREINEVKNITKKYLATIGNRQSPIQLDFRAVTTGLYKIILPAVMVLGDVFIRGGALKVVERPDGISFEANSDAALSESKLRTYLEVLKGNLPEENPSQTAPLLYLQSRLAGKNVQINLSFDQHRATLNIG